MSQLAELIKAFEDRHNKALQTVDECVAREEYGQASYHKGCAHTYALAALKVKQLLKMAQTEAAPQADDPVRPPPCGKCRTCQPNQNRMVVCEHCGNKRCPHATDCGHACTNSNEPGQPGSCYA